MPTIKVEAELSADKLLEAAEQLSLPDLEQLVSRLLAVQAQRKVPNLSEEETALLMRINSALPPEARHRYQKLIDKRRREHLTESEYEELIALSNEVEEQQAERLEAVAELARIRNTSLRKLMDALGIKSLDAE